MSSRFGVIRKKVKTWIHLPEKPIVNTKELVRMRMMSQLIDTYKT